MAAESAENLEHRRASRVGFYSGGSGGGLWEQLSSAAASAADVTDRLSGKCTKYLREDAALVEGWWVFGVWWGAEGGCRYLWQV